VKICYFVYVVDSIGPLVHITEFSKAFKHLNPEFTVFYINKGKAKKPSNIPKVHLIDKIRRKQWYRIFARYGKPLKGLFHNIKYFREECRILRKEKPDIIIARYEAYFFSIVVLAKMKKIPILLECNFPGALEVRRYDQNYFHIPFLPESIDRITFNLSDAMTVVSGNLKQHFVEKYNISPEKILINPNGVDPEVFNPKIDTDRPSSTNILENKVVIGFVGSFHQWHSVMDLVQVTCELLEEGLDVQLLLVGDGNQRKEIEELIKLKHLEKDIILTGYVSHDKTAAYIAAMNIAVMPGSNSYGSPLKIFEYMAMEKPVVAPNLGPIREVITHGENGMLFRGREGLRKQIALLAKDKSLREKIAKNARDTITSRFTWKKNAQRVLDVCWKVYNTSYKKL